MTSDEKPCDFGHYLQSCRRAKGKSLQEVYQQTKISVTSLKYLENEDMQNLPAPVFVKGFVRAYALAVDADVQEALARFDENCTLHQDSLLATPDTATRSLRFWRNLGLGLLLLGVVIFGAYLVINWQEGRRIFSPAQPESAPMAEPGVVPQDAQEAALQKKHEATPQMKNESAPQDQGDQGGGTPLASDSSEVVAPEMAKTPSSPPSSAGSGHAVDSEARPGASSAAMDVRSRPGPTNSAVDSELETAIDPVSPLPGAETATPWLLHITVLEPTWLEVTIDDHPPKEMSLEPDEEVNLKAVNQFNLLIGNAGGISLKLNDQLIGVPGKSGQVRNVRLP